MNVKGIPQKWKDFVPILLIPEALIWLNEKIVAKCNRKGFYAGISPRTSKYRSTSSALFYDKYNKP
jgi:hypothetical protein